MRLQLILFISCIILIINILIIQAKLNDETRLILSNKLKEEYAVSLSNKIQSHEDLKNFQLDLLKKRNSQCVTNEELKNLGKNLGRDLGKNLGNNLSEHQKFSLDDFNNFSVETALDLTKKFNNVVII